MTANMTVKPLMGRSPDTIPRTATTSNHVGILNEPELLTGLFPEPDDEQLLDESFQASCDFRGDFAEYFPDLQALIVRASVM